MGAAFARCRAVAESALMRALQYDAYGSVDRLTLRDATAPSWQELSSRLQHWSVQPCVRPVSAAHEGRWP